MRCLETGVWGGHYNVLANIKNMEDKANAAEVKGLSFLSFKIFEPFI